MRHVVVLVLVWLVASIPATTGSSGEGQRPRGREQDVRRLTISVAADARLLDALELFEWNGQSASYRRIDNLEDARGTTPVVVAAGACVPTYVLRSTYAVSAPLRVAPDGCGVDELLEATLFWRADVRGRLLPPPGRVTTRSAELEVRTCGGSKQVVSTYPIAVGPAGQWEATVPAECLLLTIAAAGLAPSSRPALVLTRGETRDLGQVRLDEGATLRARVVDIETGTPLSDAGVRVVDSSAVDDAVRRVLQGLDLSSRWSAKTDESGWCRLTDLPEGFVNLVVTAKGRAPAFTEAVELVGGGEVVIDPVGLGRSGSVTVTVPSASPDGAESPAYLVTVSPRLGAGFTKAAVSNAKVGTDGVATFSNLSLGTWRIDLLAFSEGKPGVRAASTEFVMTSGAHQAVTLDPVSSVYRGRLSVGDQPIEARIVLRGVEGRNDRLYSTSTPDGLFEAVLPAPGGYDVEISSVDGGVRATVPGVLFDVPWTIVEVHLAAGRVRGRVTDEAGAPVEGAVVGATHGEAQGSAVGRDVLTASTRTDAGGTFLLQGLAEGRWEIRAQTTGQNSPSQIVTVRERQSEPEVTLVLARAETFVGRVVTIGGEAVADARGELWLVSSRSGEVPVPHPLSTDRLGEFRVRLDRPAAGFANIIVFSPLRPAAAFRVPAQPPVATLAVPESGGELRLSLPRAAAREIPLNLLALVNGAGAMMTVAHATQFGAAFVRDAADRTLIVFPALSPGSWQILRYGSVAEGLGFGPSRPAPVVGTVYLAPGAIAEVMLLR